MLRVNILMMFNGVNEDELLKSAESDKGITNFDILSQIMPPLSMKYKTNSYKDGKDEKNRKDDKYGKDREEKKDRQDRKDRKDGENGK